MRAPTMADLSDLVGTIQPLTDAEIDHARRHAAEHAHSPADLQDLLEALGIAHTAPQEGP